MDRDLDDPGGENLELILLQNGKVIFKRDAVLHSVAGNSRRYKADDTDLFAVGGPRDPIKVAEKLLKAKGSR